MKRAVFGVAFGITAVALAGCSGQSGTPSGAWGPSLTPAVTHLQSAAELAPDSTFNVSGTYDGSAHWSDHGKSYSASLAATLTQNGAHLSGSFTLSRNGKTAHLTVEDGTVKIEGKKKAALAFRLYDSKGQYATATATVKAKKLTGTANAEGTDVSFSAKKAKK
jgi:hypothetical protein